MYYKLLIPDKTYIHTYIHICAMFITKSIKQRCTGRTFLAAEQGKGIRLRGGQGNGKIPRGGVRQKIS